MKNQVLRILQLKSIIILFSFYLPPVVTLIITTVCLSRVYMNAFTLFPAMFRARKPDEELPLASLEIPGSSTIYLESFKLLTNWSCTAWTDKVVVYLVVCSWV